jgi:hypothetical protein
MRVLAWTIEKEVITVAYLVKVMELRSAPRRSRLADGSERGAEAAESGHGIVVDPGRW